MHANVSNISPGGYGAPCGFRYLVDVLGLAETLALDVDQALSGCNDDSLGSGLCT
jgi:hypothetical protein